MNNELSALRTLTETGDISPAQFKGAFKALVDGELPPLEAAAFLAALRMKKENSREIGEAARYVREKAVPVRFEERPPMIFDTCGTGGSGFNKLNVSTAAFFVLAGAGIAVAKHGNRAASGRCGSADVMEALGINIAVSPEAMRRVFEKTGMAFLFAPLYHPVLKNVAGLRKELGIRTIFNLLGPLCNPYLPTHQTLGVSRKELLIPMAEALAVLGISRAFVVHSGGFDEASLHASTDIVEVRGSNVSGRKRLAPESFGFKKVSLAGLTVENTPAGNAACILAIFNGTEKGPQHDLVALNAALGLVLAGKHSSFKGAVRQAAALIAGGKALQKVEELKEALSHA